MVKTEFNLSRIPQIIFGIDKFWKIDDAAKKFGEIAMIVTGSRSLKKTGLLNNLFNEFNNKNIIPYHISLSGEPSPEFVDKHVELAKNEGIDFIVAIGGGSVLDAGKAVSAMITKDDSITNYLEGIGSKQHDGKKIPLIAVPTTAGTGSEATKNAVISKVGKEGYKKSLRHENFIPDLAIIDPKLTVSCPHEVTAYTGLDAVTQLLEAYTSNNASIMTDMLAWSGLQHAARSLLTAYNNGDNINARTDMSYAALLSGITLANAGLGAVHGFASTIGGYYDIPHGVVCGTLFAAVTQQNIIALNEKDKNHIVLKKYSETGYMFAGKNEKNIEEGCDLLVDILFDWTEKLKIPKLSEYGIKKQNIDKLVKESGQKNNPVKLSGSTRKKILESRL